MTATSPPTLAALAQAIAAALPLSEHGRIAALCREALNAAPREKFFLLHLGNALLAQEQTEDAVAVLLQADAIHRNSPAIQTGLVKGLLKLRRFAEAVPVLRSLIARQPHPGLHEQLAQCLTALNRDREALAEITAATAMKHDDAPLHARAALLARTVQNIDTAAAFAQRALTLDPALPDAHYEWASVLSARTRHAEAETHLAKAVALAPETARFRLRHALELKTLNRMDEAAAQVRAVLAAEPGNLNAQHILRAWTSDAPADVDTRYVERLFDSYADNFERHLVDGLQYVGPELLKTMLAAVCPDRPGFAHVVDIGCGTGLGLVALKERFEINAATGIDLSQRMLDKAAEKHIYSRLIRADATAALADFPGAADLIVALEVFVYIGDLNPVFAAVRAALQLHGYFVCSIETLSTGTYVLQANGRVGHAIAYVEETAARHGLCPVRSAAVALRQTHGKDVDGHMWVFQAQAVP